MPPGPKSFRNLLVGVDAPRAVVLSVRDAVAVDVRVAGITDAVAVLVQLVLVGDVGQLSQASPTPSPSVSFWSGLATNGQLSNAFEIPSPSWSATSKAVHVARLLSGWQ